MRKDFQKFKGKFLKNPGKLLEWEVRHAPHPATAKERGKHLMGDDELTTIARTSLALLSIGIFLLLPCKQSLAMHGPAHDDKSVLILGSGWGARTTSGFSTYRAIILGDPNCFVRPFGTVEITL